VQNRDVSITAAQRDWLKRMLDELARRRLREASAGARRCRCGAPLGERRAGCSACKSRYWARRRELNRRFRELTFPRPERQRGGLERWRRNGSSDAQDVQNVGPLE
jgi:hypothetical protein